MERETGYQKTSKSTTRARGDLLITNTETSTTSYKPRPKARANPPGPQPPRRRITKKSPPASAPPPPPPPAPPPPPKPKPRAPQVGGSSGSGSSAHQQEVQRRLEKEAEIQRRGKEIRQREFERQLALVNAKPAAPLAIEDAPYPILDPTVVRREYKGKPLMDLVEKVRAAQARYTKRMSDKPQPFNTQLLLHDVIPALLQIASMIKTKIARDGFRTQLEELQQDVRTGQLSPDSVDAIDDIINAMIRFINKGG